MRYLFKVFFLMLIPLVSFGAEVMQTCQLGNQDTHVIKVTREKEIASSHIYALHYSGRPQYFFDSADASRGLSVHISCIGKKQRSLLVYGEFTSNFLQGFVIVRDHTTGKLHRLDFAERSPPKWVYMSNRQTLVIMETHGVTEYGKKKYVVYRRAHEDGAEVHVSGANALPAADGFEVVVLQGEPHK